MIKYDLYIPIPPIPWKRHGTFLRNGRVFHYDKSAKDKENFRKELLALNSKMYFHDQILFVELIFSSVPAESLSESKRNSLLWQLYDESHMDCDNLEKLVLDACNGILWKDDCKVVCLKSTKIHTEKPFTKISIMPKNKANFDGNRRIMLKISPTEMQELIDECKTLSRIYLYDVKEFLGRLESSHDAASNILVDFVKNNYTTIHKLHKEISKWPQESSNE